MGKLRAVTYNRCSTEEESQKDALVKQVRESKNCIAEQGWLLVDTYVEAKSGTTVKGRNEYSRLFRDLESDKFDVIVIKSQDRLMRNAKDWYLFLDRMQRNRKRLYIYLDHKFYTPDDALITGIKAILAEEYSRELSKKINNAHRNRQREGKRFVFTNRTYGYRKLPDGSIRIEQREADMVRLVFELSANGYGTHSSAEILCQRGYRNRKGNRIGASLIRNLIRNPIYKGTIVQNRQHYDFESRQVYQNPQSEWIIHENAIPAIIDDDLFQRANRGLDVRRQDKKRDGIDRKEKNPGKYHLTGKLFCGLCGSPFYRTVRQNQGGEAPEWKCSNYLRSGRKKTQLRRDQLRKAGREETEGCDNIHLNEGKLYDMMAQLCRERDQDPGRTKERLLEKTLSLLRRALAENDAAPKREEMESLLARQSRQKEILLEKLLDGTVTDEEYKTKDRELQDKIARLREELENHENHNRQDARLDGRIRIIRGKLENGIIGQAQVADMIGSVRRIEVFPDCLEFCFPLQEGMEFSAKEDYAVIRHKTGQFMTFRMPQTCSTSRRPQIDAQKGKILELMGDRPRITAKEIAGQMQVNLSLVHRRIRELKSEGRISYSTPNGRGEWRIHGGRQG